MDIAKELRDAYMQAILAGDAVKAHQVIDRGLVGGVIPSKLYLDVLMPAQTMIGERWHCGEVSIAQEHIATQITLSQMARLRALLKTRLKLGLKAVVTSVQGDQHFIGAQAVADFLVVDGWEVDFLGADTPNSDLRMYVKARQANLLCVSVSMPGLVPAFKELIEEIRKLPAPPKILAGGGAFIQDRSLLDDLGADGFAEDPHKAVTLARQLCGMLSPENALALFLRKLGQSVHEYRKMRGMSQQELARASDLDRAYISAVEHGKQNISIGAISKLARALEVSIEELLLGIG